MAWLPSSGPEKLLAMWTKSDMKYWRRSKRATIWGYFMGKEWHEIQSRNLCNVNVRLLIFILLWWIRWANSQDSTTIPINGSSNTVNCKSSNIVPTTYLGCGHAMLRIQTTTSSWLLGSSMDKKISSDFFFKIPKYYLYSRKRVEAWIRLFGKA